MLIDTSGWLSIFDTRETSHDRALALYGSRQQLLTHSYILVEFVSLANARRTHRQSMLTFFSGLISDADIEIIWVDDQLTLRAFDLLESRTDKAWSLCDAVSFVIMSDVGIAEALTTDRHFEQAGFTKLLDH